MLRGRTGDARAACWAALIKTLFKVGAFIAVMLLVGRRVMPWCSSASPAPARANCSRCACWRSRWAWPSVRRNCSACRLRWARSSPALLLNESEFSHQAATETLPLRDAFAVLFFVSVGMLFDPMILVERPLEVLATFAIIVLRQVGLVAWVFAARVRQVEPRSALLLSVSLAQIGEFSFILAGLACNWR